MVCGWRCEGFQVKLCGFLFFELVMNDRLIDCAVLGFNSVWIGLIEGGCFVS